MQNRRPCAETACTPRRISAISASATPISAVQCTTEVKAQIAVQSGKFPQFPQALRQSIPALHSARETANPRLFLAGRACGVETTAQHADLGARSSLWWVRLLVRVSPISVSLTEEHNVSNTNIQVKQNSKGQLVGQCTFGSSFLPPVPGSCSAGILASEFLRTIRRKNSRAAGAERQSINRSPAH